MSYFVTCTHEQRILNGTSSDTSLCHWGYLEKKFFPRRPRSPRCGQIWPDLGRLGKFFFQKKKKNFPDLARSGRPRSGDLARSGSIRVKTSITPLFFLFLVPTIFAVMPERHRHENKALCTTQPSTALRRTKCKRKHTRLVQGTHRW